MTTWLAPYLRVYQDAYGEPASPQALKRIARGMKQLEGVFARDEIIMRFARYCGATELKWYSVERFAETWPAWAERRHPRASQYQSVDEADRKAGLL
jgi:hypothetical protein